MAVELLAAEQNADGRYDTFILRMILKTNQHAGYAEQKIQEYLNL